MGDDMQISHDAQLILLGAIIGGVFSLLAAFAGAHHEDWVDTRRKKLERKKALENASEMKETLREEVIQEVLKALESTKVGQPLSESEKGDDERSE
jgi:hypothetical protein